MSQYINVVAYFAVTLLYSFSLMKEIILIKRVNIPNMCHPITFSTLMLTDIKLNSLFHLVIIYVPLKLIFKSYSIGRRDIHTKSYRDKIHCYNTNINQNKIHNQG